MSKEEENKLSTLNIVWFGPESTEAAYRMANLSRGVFDHDVMGIMEGLDELEILS